MKLVPDVNINTAAEADFSKENLLSRKEVLASRRNYWILRRAQDVLFSGLALVILSPLLLILYIIIFLDDPHGSPIFRQVRCGRDGKTFTMYKFRSMYMDAEKRLAELIDQNEMDGPAFKMKNDPRITRVGKIIRKVSLDELPQLVNIFRGDMSIVGPRPPLPREVEQYDAWQMQRLLVTPGLTCFWQIQPKRNDLPFDEWVALDVKYIQECSFTTDWRIIFKTFKAVLGAEGI